LVFGHDGAGGSWFSQPVKSVIVWLIWLELCGSEIEAAEADDATGALRKAARAYVRANYDRSF